MTSCYRVIRVDRARVNEVLLYDQQQEEPRFNFYQMSLQPTKKNTQYLLTFSLALGKYLSNHSRPLNCVMKSGRGVLGRAGEALRMEPGGEETEAVPWVPRCEGALSLVLGGGGAGL